MWIMLISKLPTRPSPPKMSIFWSLPWPDDENAGKQKKKCVICGEKIDKYNMCGCQYGPTLANENDPYFLDMNKFFPPSFIDKKVRYTHGVLKDPNWIGARKIHFHNEDIRVFPHEFSKVSTENMRAYIFGISGDPPSHKLVSDGSVAQEKLIKAVMDTDTRLIYDAALCDGCTPEQATMTALGMNITIQDDEFPALGWYRPEKWITDVFCEDWEAVEHTEKIKEEKIYAEVDE